MLSLFLLLESLKRCPIFLCRRRNISILTPIFSTEFNSRETTGFLLQTVCFTNCKCNAEGAPFYRTVNVILKVFFSFYRTVNVMPRVFSFTGL